MMKQFYIFLTLALVLVLGACGESNATEEEAGNIIKIGSTPDGYPQVYSEDEEVKGFSADVYQEVFDRLGYEIEWSLTDWTGALLRSRDREGGYTGQFCSDTERQEKVQLYRSLLLFQGRLGGCTG